MNHYSDVALRAADILADELGITRAEFLRQFEVAVGQLSIAPRYYHARRRWWRKVMEGNPE